MMIEGTEERQIRAAAVNAAGAFVGGSGLNGGDVHTLLFVTEVMQEYITGGTKAALVRYEQGPYTEEEASSQDPHVTGNGDSPILNARAQELAQEAYTASNRIQLSKIGTEADNGRLKDETVKVDGVIQSLRSYLNKKWSELPDEGDSARIQLRSELGM